MKDHQKQDLYRQMVRIRYTDDALLKLFAEKKISGFLHTSHGHEAMDVGFVNALAPTDLIVSYYRGHGHYIARHGNLFKMFAEILGKKEGVCGGVGGSLHLIDKSIGIMATSGIVTEALPLAIGLGLANKRFHKDTVVIVFFGDGATNNGVFYESLNFAAYLKLKILFVCENNGLSQSERTPLLMGASNIAVKATALGVPGISMEGTDVVQVYRKAQNIIEGIRKDGHARLVDCHVKRLRGHTAFDGDGLRYRSQRELENDWASCPLEIFKKHEGAKLQEILDRIDREEYAFVQDQLQKSLKL